MVGIRVRVRVRVGVGVGVRVSDGIQVRVTCKIDHLERRELPQLYGLVKTVDAVVTQGQTLQVGALIEAFDHAYLVAVKRQILQLFEIA